MGTFIIEPQIPEFSRVWDNAFLWKEKNIYIMSNHRLALWCWLQQEEIQNQKYSLIHIDRHTDARKWEGPGESDCLKKAVSTIYELNDLGRYEDLQCPCHETMSGRKVRPCITWDNFVHLAIEAKLFDHYYIYSSEGDWNKNLPGDIYDYYEKISDIYNLDQNIEKCTGKCILDIDLDFFDLDSNVTFPKRISEDKLLSQVFDIIEKYRSKISMITISINEIPEDPLWDKRQSQLTIIKEILNIDIPIPIMKE